MKLFDLRKFSFDAVNPEIVSGATDNINLNEFTSGFNISIDVEINNSEIFQILQKKNNVVVEENVIKYNSICCNNEIVMSIYDYVKRIHSKDDLIRNFEKIIDTLNIWILK